MSTVGRQIADNQHDRIKVGRGVPRLETRSHQPSAALITGCQSGCQRRQGRRTIYPDPHGRCLTAVSPFLQ